MKISTVQAIISITLVAISMIVTAVIALAPVLGGYPMAPYTEHLKTFTSFFSGIVGTVLGYYFGRRAESEA